MMTLLTAWSWLKSKAGQVGMIILAIGAAVLFVHKSGGDSEKLKQLEAQEKEHDAHNKRRADIDRLSGDDVRDRLRNDWSVK